MLVSINTYTRSPVDDKVWPDNASKRSTRLRLQHQLPVRCQILRLMNPCHPIQEEKKIVDEWPDNVLAKGMSFRPMTTRPT